MDIKPTVHNARKEGGTLVCFLKIKRNPQHHHKQDSNVICKDYTTMENTTQNFCPLTFYELCPTQGEIASKRNLRNRKWLYIWSTLHVYTMDLSWKPNCSTPQPDLPQHDRPTACVMAQQHPATALSFPRGVI